MTIFHKLGLAISLLGLLNGCSHKIYPEDSYQVTAVKTDGDLGEWSRPLRFGSSSGLAQYNVTNDKDNLYISLETHDETTVMKIMRSGINIYIDPGAGKSKKMSLAFPLPNTSFANAVPHGNSPTAKPEQTDMLRSLLLQSITFNAIGFSGMENKLYDVADKSQIGVGIALGSGNSLGYEAVIPLKYIFGSNEQAIGRNLSVGIVINAMKNAADHVPSPNPAARGQMGAGGRRGSGGGGNKGIGNRGNNANGVGNSNSAADRATMYKSDSNWYTFRLAAK